jgi:hypothetical protein
MRLDVPSTPTTIHENQTRIPQEGVTSPLVMLNKIDATGGAIRLGSTENGGPIVMRALKVCDFNFTSLSDAV